MAVNKFLTAIVLCVVLCCLLVGCSSETAAQEQLYIPEMTAPIQANYQTVTVQKGNSSVNISGTGTVNFLYHESLSWDGLNATLSSIEVEKGQQVKKGDILMTFVVEQEQIALGALRLEQNRLQQELLDGKASRQAAIDAKKQEALGLTGSERTIAEQTAAKLQAEYDSFVFETTKQLDSVNEQILGYEEKNAANVLVAPFDGVIEQIANLKPEESVKGQVLVEMYRTDIFEISLKDTNKKLRYNTPVTLTFGKGENIKTVFAHVIAAPNILPVSVSQNAVLVELDDSVSVEDLMGACTYQAQVELIEDITVIPRKAVHNENGASFVYLLEDGVAVKRYISVNLMGTDMLWVLDGLEEGQILIVD